MIMGIHTVALAYPEAAKPEPQTAAIIAACM